ncbi:MAG: class I SAM-dependent methyltransferase [Ilumatobacteraceae bacterium]
MEPAPGAGTFKTSGAAYDAFMGRYSRPLAKVFADTAGVVSGQNVLDVGCGPGALTGVLVDRLGADAVAACDPSEPFVAECAALYPGVDVRAGRAEAIPFDDDRFDVALAQLVLHFVSDPAAAAGELGRVVRPGGLVGASVWDFAKGMEMLRLFWDAALEADPAAPDEARTLRFGGQGEIAAWLDDAGFDAVVETTLEVTSTYTGFDELWSGFLAGVGPAGSYCVSLPEAQRAAVREALFDRLGSPGGALTLTATARAACGRVPV